MNEKLFHIGIKGVIVNNDKALILRDSTRYRGIDLPGGKIEEGETIEQALKRELDQEIGLKEFEMGEILHAHIRGDYNKDGVGLMLIFYRVNAKLGEIRLSEEHESFEMVGREELENLDFRNDGVKIALQKAL